MMNHAISDYFHFDQKFFHTLKPLFFKPGFLTNEYMAGKRVQYLHPVKMYIFISLVYFLLLFQSGHQFVNVNNTPDDPKSEHAAMDSVARDPGIPSYLKPPMIAQLKKDSIKNAGKHIGATAKSKVDASTYFLSPTADDSTYTAYLASQQKLPENKRDGMIERFYNKKAFGYRAEYGARTKDVILEAFDHNIPKMMFVLLPICALILMISFRNNKKYYVEHLIYSFHLHCFIFLFLAIVIVLEWLTPSADVNGIISFLAGIAIIWYAYRSLRVVYHRSRWRTVSKLIGAYIMYLLSFAVCIALVFIISALAAG